MEATLEQLDADLGENDNHVQLLAKHLDNVRQQIQFANAKVASSDNISENLIAFPS